MFRFAHPTYLYLLLLIPVLVAIYIVVRWRMRRQLRKFGDVNLMAHLMPDVSRLRVHLKFALMMTALALVIFIMARPQYGTRNEEVKRSGIEVMIACDVSYSMLCEDVNPSRLDKSKMMVSKLIEQFDRDKVGLVAFAGSAITLLPMTADYVSAKMFLDQLNPETVSVQGTNMAEAIQRSIASFSDKKNVGKALILITDAEDHEEGAVEMAKEAKKAGVQIFVLSVGTDHGGPIPMGDGSYKKDLSGNVVTTKLNERVGKEIAKAGNGLYIHVDRSNQAQDILDAEISKMQKADISMSMYSEYDEQFIAVAILLLLVLIAECIVMERRSPFIRRLTLFSRTPKSVQIILLALCFTFVNSTVSAQINERDYVRRGNRSFRSEQYDKAETDYLKSLEVRPTYEAFYNLGLTYLLQGKDSTAVAKMMDADSLGTDNQLKRAMNFHNLGNVWYAQGSYLLKSNQDATSAFQNAVNLYKSSLRCNPNDDETRYNLAKAQYQLKKSQQQQQQNQQNQDQQQQKKEEEKKDEQKKQDQQPEQQNEQPQKPQQQKEDKNDMSEQTAEQLLNSAQQDEKDVQRKLKQQNATRRSLEKDW
jgi:Ca-activated chloride channel family protein